MDSKATLAPRGSAFSALCWPSVVQADNAKAPAAANSQRDRQISRHAARPPRRYQHTCIAIPAAVFFLVPNGWEQNYR
jgi:hypothetical protein